MMALRSRVRRIARRLALVARQGSWGRPPLKALFQHDVDPARLKAFTDCRPEEPGHADIFMRDVLGGSEPQHDDEQHLRAALEWLLRSQEVTGAGGFAAGYCFRDGWLPPYPETTGYIITTLWDAYARLNDERLKRAAVLAADWEIEVQLDSGAVQAGYFGHDPSGFWKGERLPAAFNTGQVMLGWNRSFVETGEARYLEAAIRAADFLLPCIDAEGIFRGGLSPGPTNPVRAYYTRVAYALAWTGQLAQRPAYGEAAARHLDWAMAQQQANAWYANAMFHAGESPLTHNMAYTAEGLWFAGELLDRKDWRESSQRHVERAMHTCERRGFFLPATLDADWKSNDTYSCLTGNAQFAGLWLRQGIAGKDLPLINAGLKMVDWLKARQALDNPCAGVRGGIAGAWPIDGGYSLFRYLNWATKYFADAVHAAIDAKQFLARHA